MTSTGHWLPYRKPNARAQLRLFCFPYAGGGASLFRTWANDLPPEIDVWPVQLPGRESRMREAPFWRVRPLVAALASALWPHLAMPFAIFGHSMGALVAFELARYLRRQQGPRPVYLFVAGFRAPQIPDPHPMYHQLPDDGFVAKLRDLEGTPEEVFQHAELMQLLLPVLRADFAVAETYVYTPEEPLECPITIFGGIQDHEARQAALAAWCTQTRASCNLHMLPGGHFFLQTAKTSLLQTIAEDLRPILAHS